MAERIDSHQHFWSYDAAEYGWIGEEMKALRRDFLPGNLAEDMAKRDVKRSVAVQARQTVGETRWLLGLAAENNSIAGVVGWMPLVSEGLEEELAALPNRAALKGLRHVLQDEPDDGLVRSPEFNRGLEVVGKAGLIYDLLVYERQMESAIGLVDRHPELRFVLDHIGKPRIAEGVMEPWRTRLKELAKRPNVCCKLSGMVTEADWKRWSAETLEPYAKTVLESFGPERTMFGSDWPVCLLATSYERWSDMVERWIEGLSTGDREAVMGRTAARVYGIDEADGQTGEYE